MKHGVNIKELTTSNGECETYECHLRTESMRDNSWKVVAYVLLSFIIVFVLSLIGLGLLQLHKVTVDEHSDISVALLSTKLHNSNETEMLIASIEDSDPNVTVSYTYYLGEVSFDVKTKLQRFTVKTNYVDENDIPIIN